MNRHTARARMAHSQVGIVWNTSGPFTQIPEEAQVCDTHSRSWSHAAPFAFDGIQTLLPSSQYVSWIQLSRTILCRRAYPRASYETYSVLHLGQNSVLRYSTCAYMSEAHLPPSGAAFT